MPVRGREEEERRGHCHDTHTGHLITARVCGCGYVVMCAHRKYGMGNGVKNAPSGPEMRKKKTYFKLFLARFLSGPSFASHADF
jgi:hypothetical protein